MTTNCHVKGGVAREVEMAKKPGEKRYLSTWHSQFLWNQRELFIHVIYSCCFVAMSPPINGIALPLPT